MQKVTVLFALLLMAGAVPASAQPPFTINDVADLTSHSDTTSDPAAYILNSGDYEITDAINIYSADRPNLIIDDFGTTLTIGPGASIMFQAAGVTQSDGELTLKGGGGIGADAMRVSQTGFTISGGTLDTTGGDSNSGGDGLEISRSGLIISGAGTIVNATGGTGSYTDGIRVNQGGVAQNGGTVMATAGAGNTAIGIQVSGGGDYNLNGGKLTAKGSDSYRLTQGVRVDSGGFNMTGGELRATGGSQNEAAGVLTLSRAFVQTGGDVYATGGGAALSHGIDARAGYSIYAGASLTATGGSAWGNTGGAHGLSTRYSAFNQYGGTVTATGGSISGVHGLHTSSTYNLSGGRVTATGGAQNAYGLYAAGFNQTGGTGIFKGDAETGSYGATIIGTYGQSAGNIEATGGDGQSASGLYAYNLVQTGGEIEAQGGGGQDARGIYATRSLSLTNGLVTAKGGSAAGAHGIYAAPAVAAVTLDQTRLTAEGGSDAEAHCLVSDNLVRAENSVIEAAGSATNSGGHGLKTLNLELTGGSLTAEGGQGDGTYGVYLAGSLTAAGTAITALGGAGNGSAGIYLADTEAILSNISLTARGGDGAGSSGLKAADELELDNVNLRAEGGDASGYGLSAISLRQTGGTLTAVGGSAATSYGVYVDQAYSVAGTLVLERTGHGASVYINHTNASPFALNFTAGSTLVPVVDLAKTNGDLASGLIKVENNGLVNIAATAQLSPLFINTVALTKGAPPETIVFMEADNAADLSDAWQNIREGATLDYRVEIKGNQYVFTVERVANPEEVAGCSVCGNSQAFVKSLAPQVRARADYQSGILNDIYVYLDNSRSALDLRNRSNYLGRTLSPQLAVRTPQSVIRQSELVDAAFRRELLADAPSANPIASPAGNSQHQWRGLFTMLYQHASVRAFCDDFDDAKESFKGALTGLARKGEYFDPGLGVYFVKGEYEAATYDADSHGVGVILGGRLHDFTGGRFNPWLDLSLSYSRQNYDQRRFDFSRLPNDSDYHTDAWRAGLAVGHDFQLFPGTTLRPRLGLEYTRIEQGGYMETGVSGLALAVPDSQYESLRPLAGLELQTELSEKLTFGASAVYRYETADTRLHLPVSLVDFQNIDPVINGENLGRSSGQVGLNLDWRMTDQAALGFDYNLSLAEKYRGHQFGLKLSVNF